jgi:hypothetical protein
VNEQKGPASSGVISIANIKTLLQSSSLTYPKPGAKEKISEGAKPEVCRYCTYRHRDRQRDVQTNRAMCKQTKIINKETAWLNEMLA